MKGKCNGQIIAAEFECRLIELHVGISSPLCYTVALMDTKYVSPSLLTGCFLLQGAQNVNPIWAGAVDGGSIVHFN